MLHNQFKSGGCNCLIVPVGPKFFFSFFFFFGGGGGVEGGNIILEHNKKEDGTVDLRL